MKPEETNKNSAPTTVGGVTFGGGNSSAPADSTPQNEVDPIVASTGEEFDAVMNGDAPTQQEFDQAPVPSNLNVAVSGPTHFDEQNTVRPIIQDPGNPNANNPNANIPNPKAKKKAPVDVEKQVKKLSTMSVIFGILTGIFMILSIVGLVMYFSGVDQTKSLENTNKSQALIIKAVEEATGVEINKPEDVPVYKATTGYIYLYEWNIKIKVPDNLDKVSYILNENYRPSICFNAVQSGIDHFPDFANIALNPGKMGCLTRIATNEGEFDAATGISFGTKVFTYKEFSYFYTDGKDYSKDTANLGLEHTARQYIKQMLTDNIESYE